MYQLRYQETSQCLSVRERAFEWPTKGRREAPSCWNFSVWPLKTVQSPPVFERRRVVPGSFAESSSHVPGTRVWAPRMRHDADLLSSRLSMIFCR
ncbi:hypothetical protein BDV09DRAFT_165805 [Aspergillus tetrazonus]